MIERSGRQRHAQPGDPARHWHMQCGRPGSPLQISQRAIASARRRLGATRNPAIEARITLFTLVFSLSAASPLSAQRGHGGDTRASAWTSAHQAVDSGATPRTCQAWTSKMIERVKYMTREFVKTATAVGASLSYLKMEVQSNPTWIGDAPVMVHRGSRPRGTRPLRSARYRRPSRAGAVRCVLVMRNRARGRRWSRPASNTVRPSRHAVRSARVPIRESGGRHHRRPRLHMSSASDCICLSRREDEWSAALRSASMTAHDAHPFGTYQGGPERREDRWSWATSMVSAVHGVSPGMAFRTYQCTESSCMPLVPVAAQVTAVSCRGRLRRSARTGSSGRSPSETPSRS